MPPSISIITAVRNGAATIKDCLECVQSQIYPAEHIIVNGASTDNTLEIIDRCRSGVAKIVSEPDDGIYDAMNKGIRLADGEIIGILNADDFYASPEVAARVVAAFSDKSIDSCYGDLVYVAEKHGNGRFARGGRLTVQRGRRGVMRNPGEKD